MLARLVASLVFAATCACASAATAQDGRWYRAESANFIVYGDLNEAQVAQRRSIARGFRSRPACVDPATEPRNLDQA